MPLNPGNSAYDSVATDYDESKIEHGDFSLHQPTSYYHGSPKYNTFEQKEIKSGHSGTHALHGIPKEKTSGVFLTPSAATAEHHGKVYKVNLPRKTKLRMDPLGKGYDYHGSVIHSGSIPSEHVEGPIRPNRRMRIANREGQAHLEQPLNYPRGVVNPVNNLKAYREKRKNKNLIYPVPAHEE